jgi:hypothetical protein
LAKEKADAKRIEAEHVEAKRIETERIEAERAEAARIEAERIEAARVEAERVEAERIEAEKLAKMMEEAKRRAKLESDLAAILQKIDYLEEKEAERIDDVSEEIQIAEDQLVVAQEVHQEYKDNRNNTYKFLEESVKVLAEQQIVVTNLTKKAEEADADLQLAQAIVIQCTDIVEKAHSTHATATAEFNAHMDELVDGKADLEHSLLEMGVDHMLPPKGKQKQKTTWPMSSFITPHLDPSLESVDIPVIFSEGRFFDTEEVCLYVSYPR